MYKLQKAVFFPLLLIASYSTYADIQSGYVNTFDLTGYEKQELQDAYNTLGIKSTATDAELEKALSKNTSSFALTQSAKSKNAFVKAAYELIKKRRSQESANRGRQQNEATQMEKDYALLGIKADATDKEVRSAYRKLSLTHHPDKGGDAATFKKILEAYERIAASRGFK